jgi:hypothetical protein
MKASPALKVTFSGIAFDLEAHDLTTDVNREFVL